MAVLDYLIGSHPQLTIGLNVNNDIDVTFKQPLVARQLNYWKQRQQQGNTQYSVRQTVEEIKKALADPQSPDQILYFYCHAAAESPKLNSRINDPARLILTGDNRLTLDDLIKSAPTRKLLPHAPLILINACESAELSPLFYEGFVPYFMARGARGVIGAECRIPASFAAEWARRFFDQFLAGVPLGDVLLELRREFFYQHKNLMGLLYALYCDGDTKVDPGLPIPLAPAT